jgi:hypothetical protein
MARHLDARALGERCGAHPAGHATVDIARITIRSTLSDTTCFTAGRVGSRIRYRIVDEYGGESLSDARERAASSSRRRSSRESMSGLPTPETTAVWLRRRSDMSTSLANWLSELRSSPFKMQLSGPKPLLCDDRDGGSGRRLLATRRCSRSVPPGDTG